MPEPLTERQRDVLHYIKNHFDREGFAPTVREIAFHFGFASPLAVQTHLDALARKGYIEREPRKTRNIRIVGQRHAAVRTLPLLGRVRAGRPVLAVEEAGEHIAVDRGLFRGRDLFALRITGDSMIDAGIQDRDIVIVRPEKSPENGSINVVLIDDEVTVKHFFREKGLIRLVPANSAMSPVTVEPKAAQVIGRVIGIVRKL